MEANRHPPRTLIVVRGNSGTGKSTVAAAVRQRYGRGVALIGQDHLRRVILWEHDSSGSTGPTPELVKATALFALRHGFHTIVEGILPTSRYATSLSELIAEHDGPSHVYYMDASFEETVRRHATRAQSEFGAEEMAAWYRPRDLLGLSGEHLIAEQSTMEEKVDYILATSRLADTPPVTFCPVQCPRCQDRQ